MNVGKLAAREQLANESLMQSVQKMAGMGMVDGESVAGLTAVSHRDPRVKQLFQLEKMAELLAGLANGATATTDVVAELEAQVEGLQSSQLPPLNKGDRYVALSEVLALPGMTKTSLGVIADAFGSGE